MAEHLTVNQVVAGSSPAGGAKKKRHELSCLFFLLSLVMAKICTAMPFLATRVKRGSTRRVFEPLSFAITTGRLSKRSFQRKLLVRDTRSPFPKYGRCASFDTSFTLIRSTPYFGYTFIKIILNDFYFTLPAGGGISGQQFCTLTQKSLFYKGFSCF